MQPHAAERRVTVDGGDRGAVRCLVAEVEQPAAGTGDHEGPDVTAAVAQRVGGQLLEDQEQAVARVVGGPGGHRGVGDAGPEVRADPRDRVHGLELPVPDVAGNGRDGHARPRFLGRLSTIASPSPSAVAGGAGSGSRPPPS